MKQNGVFNEKSKRENTMGQANKNTWETLRSIETCFIFHCLSGIKYITNLKVHFKSKFSFSSFLFLLLSYCTIVDFVRF